MLRHIEGLGYDEMSSILGVQRDTLKMRVYKARNLLCQSLAHLDGVPSMKRSTADITGSERLVQQFIDQELPGEERVRLLVQIGRDDALRERLIDLERLDARRSSAVAAPAGA